MRVGKKTHEIGIFTSGNFKAGLKVMTISIRVSGDFHQRACPVTRNELDHNCDSECLRLNYRCSRYARE